MITVYVQSLGIVAPGLSDWSSARTVLTGENDYCAQTLSLSAPDLLPAAERRRSSDSVRLALRVAIETLSPEQTRLQQPAAIFSSAYGDPMITHKLCELLSGEPPAASPTLFHNSVHNAPAGYWGIATGNMSASSSIAAGNQSFVQGLLASAAQCRAEQRSVLFLCYDLPYPEPMATKCPIGAPFACALRLNHEPTTNSMGRLSISMGGDAESGMAQQALESLRLNNPAARSLPLLEAIARGNGVRHFNFNEAQTLRLEFSPC